MRLQRADLCAADEGQLCVSGLGAGVDHTTFEAESITRLTDTGLGIDCHLHTVARHQGYLAVAIAGDAAAGRECQRTCTVDAGDLQLTQCHVTSRVHAHCVCSQHARTVAHVQATGPGDDAATHHLATRTQLQHITRIQEYRSRLYVANLHAAACNYRGIAGSGQDIFG